MTLMQSARSFRTPAYSGRAISVKIQRQEVLTAKHGTEYACSKRSEIDSRRTVKYGDCGLKLSQPDRNVEVTAKAVFWSGSAAAEGSA